MHISLRSAAAVSVLLSAVIVNAATGADDGSRSVRAADIGIEVGTMEPGEWNAITDVSGVIVGHRTIVRGDSVRTGVTAVLPHRGNIFREKVPAAVFVANGFGKLAGFTQVRELGNLETPIVLTNTLSVGTAVTAVTRYALDAAGNEDVRSVNAVVGETNDGYLNDIRGMHVGVEDVLLAIETADSGPVGEGSVGAGTGTVAFGFKGGIGTASRLVPGSSGGHHTIGVLVQSNFGGMLDINGAPVGLELEKAGSGNSRDGGDGSCMIVVATDAPLCPRNLERLASRAIAGMARTGSYMSNGSGDYVIAFSTAYTIPHEVAKPLDMPRLLRDNDMTPLFVAVADATREAVYNSLLAATTVKGYRGHTACAIPVDEVLRICGKYNVLNKK